MPEIQIKHIAKKQQGLYANTAALIRERTADAEKRLAETMAVRKALQGTQRGGSLDFETVLIAAVKAAPIDDTATITAPAHKLACADHMIPLFIRSLKPNGVEIGLLEPMPTTLEMAACGFPAGANQEKDFMAYFTEYFVPYVAVAVFPTITATLSERERSDIQLVLGKNGLGIAYNLPDNAADLKAILVKERDALRAEEEQSDKNTISLAIAGMSTIKPAPGSRREALEKVIGDDKGTGGLDDASLQHRLNYMKKLNQEVYINGITPDVPLNSILNKVDVNKGGLPIYDPTIGTTKAGTLLAIGGNSMAGTQYGYVLDGDSNTVKPPESLSALRKPADNDLERESKIVLAKAIDEVSTRPDAIRDKIAELDREEVVLREEIWKHRKKEFADLLNLLPSAEYQAFLVHQEPTLALAAGTPIEKTIDFLGKLADRYGPPVVTAPTQKQKDNLEVITKVRELAQAIHAEDTALTTTFPGFDLATRVPSEAEAKNPAVIAARTQRKTAEQELEKLGVKQGVKLAEQEWRYGQITAKDAGDKISLEEAAWEAERTKSLMEKINTGLALEPEVADDPVPIVNPLVLPHDAVALAALDPGVNPSASPTTTDNPVVFARLLAEYHGKKTIYEQALADNLRANQTYEDEKTAYDAVVARNLPRKEARDRNTARRAAHTGLGNPLTVATIVKLDGSRDPNDRPFVSVRVREKKVGNETDILLSKGFKIGKDGQELDAAGTRLKMMDLLIYDQANHEYHTDRLAAPTDAASAARVALGGDLGDGRLSAILNSGTIANVRGIENTANPDINKKWVCEMKVGGSFNVYRAEVNIKTGEVTKDKTAILTDPEKLAVKAQINELLTEGLKSSTKLSYDGSAAVAPTFPNDPDVIRRDLQDKPEVQLKEKAESLSKKPDAAKTNNNETRLLWGEYATTKANQAVVNPKIQPVKRSFAFSVRNFFKR